jgi:GcrA cell cycle regulator
MFSSLPQPDPAAPHRGLSIWTPERDRRAVRLYLVEGFTAAEVADALGPGFSRAAVIGKMRRLGCLKREARAVIAEACAAKPKRKPPRAGTSATTRLPPQHPPQPLPPLREIGATGSPAPLACLPRGACRWPIDDPGPGRMHLALFCGGAAEAGAYCTAHRALSARRSL